jgi:aspartate aminotransferase
LELSNRVNAIKPSPTLAISARAAQLKAEGKDIVNLGVGGTPSLKQAVAAKFKRDNGLDYAAKQILVSRGGKQSFYNLCQAVIGAGDEVIIPAPYWVSYPDIVILADGKPVIVEAGIAQGFKITPAQLETAITPRTKMLVINSPSNPTGAVYTLAELAALGEVLRK